MAVSWDILSRWCKAAALFMLSPLVVGLSAFILARNLGLDLAMP